MKYFFIFCRFKVKLQTFNTGLNTLLKAESSIPTNGLSLIVTISIMQLRTSPLFTGTYIV